MSLRAQHLTPSISIRTTRYVTEQLLVVNSVVVVLSQIEEWYFPLHFTHDLLLRHSEVRYLVPLQLKHIFFLEYQPAFFNITYCFTVTGFMPRFLTINTVTVLITFIICLICILTFECFLRARNYFRISGSPLS